MTAKWDDEGVFPALREIQGIVTQLARFRIPQGCVAL